MLSFFPRDVLDEILDLIESVSEGFLFYSSIALCFHRPDLLILMINDNNKYKSIQNLLFNDNSCLCQQKSITVCFSVLLSVCLYAL